MPALYMVKNGIAEPRDLAADLRRSYRGDLCPDCLRRGRHMSWCSRFVSPEPPEPLPKEPPRPDDEPEIRTRPKRSPRFDVTELAGSIAADDYAWACKHAGDDPKATKLKRAIERGQRARLAYLAAGIGTRDVVSGMTWWTVDMRTCQVTPTAAPPKGGQR